MASKKKGEFIIGQIVDKEETFEWISTRNSEPFSAEEKKFFDYVRKSYESKK